MLGEIGHNGLFVRSVLFVCYIIINLLDGEVSLCFGSLFVGYRAGYQNAALQRCEAGLGLHKGRCGGDDKAVHTARRHI